MTLEDFCGQNNISIIYHSFPTKIRGLCIKVDDGFVVAINPRFSSGSMKRTLMHEIMHIMKNHFCCESCEYEKCEKEIDNLLIDMKTQINSDEALY